MGSASQQLSNSPVAGDPRRGPWLRQLVLFWAAVAALGAAAIIAW